MMAKLLVLSGTLLQASGGETFWPVQFGFLAKLPAFFGASMALSNEPGEIRRNAVGGPSTVCVAQAPRASRQSVAAILFIVRGSFPRSGGRSFPSLRPCSRAPATPSVSVVTDCLVSGCETGFGT